MLEEICSGAKVAEAQKGICRAENASKQLFTAPELN